MLSKFSASVASQRDRTTSTMTNCEGYGEFVRIRSNLVEKRLATRPRLADSQGVARPREVVDHCRPRG
eukprot:573040-Lingulodinium_polyedra.AAC.1